jgi:ribosome recycling factor
MWRLVPRAAARQPQSRASLSPHSSVPPYLSLSGRPAQSTQKAVSRPARAFSRAARPSPRAAALIRVPAAAPAGPTVVLPSRFKSKKKEKKEKNKKGKRKQEDSDSESDGDDADGGGSGGEAVEFDADAVEQQLSETLANFTKRLDKVQVLGAGQSSLAGIRVREFGDDGESDDSSLVPLTQVAQVSQKSDGGASVLHVKPFDEAHSKAVLAVLRAESEGGSLAGARIEPSAGDGVRVFLPKASKEHRERLAKGAQKELAAALDGIRGKRQKAVSELKKQAKSMSKDDRRAGEQALQKLVDAATKSAREMCDKKIAQLKST